MNGTKGTILLTGANGGLGAAIAKQIASKPQFRAYHTLYMVRDADSAHNLEASLAGSLSPSSEVFSLDLTNNENIRKVAEAINARVATGEIPRIRALILNAGLMDFGKQTWTKDGFDTTFSANYLGHWLLTLLLLKSMDKKSGRIVIVSSQTHDPYDKRNDKNKAWADKKYKTVLQDKTNFEAEFEAIAKGTWSSAKEDPSWGSGLRRYGASKLFLVMMMHNLQHRMSQDPVLKNVCILGFDPGTMNTSIKRHGSWVVRVLYFQIMVPIMAAFPGGDVRSTKKSASHILKAAFVSDPKLGEFPKAVYLDGTKRYETSAESKDVLKMDLVWKESIHYTQLKKGETSLVKWH